MATQEKEVSEKFKKASRVEESFLKQKSRIQWLQLGDGNNAFFHHSLMARRNKNQITHIKVEDGTVLSNEAVIQVEAQRFFQQILGPQIRREEVDVEWDVCN